MGNTLVTANLHFDSETDKIGLSAYPETLSDDWVTVRIGNLNIFVKSNQFGDFERDLQEQFAKAHLFFAEAKAMKDAQAAFRAEQNIDAATEQTEAVAA